jgi:hypothetical protein
MMLRRRRSKRRGRRKEVDRYNYEHHVPGWFWRTLHSYSAHGLARLRA